MANTEICDKDLDQSVVVLLLARLYVQVLEFLKLIYRVPKFNQCHKRYEYGYLWFDYHVDWEHSDADKIDQESIPYVKLSDIP